MTVTQRSLQKLSHPAAFAGISAVLVLLMAAAAAPSPLYVVYQAAWGFSATTLTVVFAVYVLGLLGSFLVLGALSDHVGRRPVLAAALALEAVAFVLFLAAGDVVVLGLARVLQGIATGAAITVLSAALVDLAPPQAPGRGGVVSGIATLGGLAGGALGSGVLVEFAPAPRQLVFVVLLVGTLLGLALLAVTPETSPRRPGALASLRPRVGVPARIRPQFYALLPMVVASWALGGLYLSLGPSVAAELFGASSHLVGGAVVALLSGTAAVVAFALRDRPPAMTLTLAAALLATGMAVTLLGIEAGSAAVAAGGTVVAGVGFGAAALGTFGSLARLARPAERGELFAVAYTFSYLSFSLPAVAAGLATTAFGLRGTVAVYATAVLLLSLAALAAQRVLAAREIAIA